MEEVSSLSFGGWRNYQVWADHEFVPKRDQRDVQPEAFAGWESSYLDLDLDAAELLADVSIDDVFPVDELEPRYTDAGHSFPLDQPAWIVRPASLQLETLISTAAGRWDDAVLNPEHQHIVAFCGTSRSLAEVSAHIHAPIGVTRLLVSYAATLGLLVVHQTAFMQEMRPTVELLQRVHSGLRRLA